MFFFRAFLTVLTFVAVTDAQSAPITIGDLSSNDDWTTSVISDASRGVEYLRLDLYRSLNYEQTLAAIAPGGEYDGWKIADDIATGRFIEALLGVNNCTTSPYFFYHCSGVNSMSASQYGQLTGSYIYDRFGSTGFAYLTEQSNDPDLIIGIFRPQPRTDPVESFDIGPSMTVATYDRATYYYQQSPSPFLLYRLDTTFDLPEPSSLALFGVMLAGLTIVRRRRPGVLYS